MGEFLDNQIQAVAQELSEKFIPHKNRAKSIMDIYRDLGMNERAEKLKDCGTKLYFEPDENNEIKLKHANFCKDRLCPMCAWRRAMKAGGQVSQIAENLKSKYNFVFLTLTVRNCSADDLHKTIGDLISGYTKLMHYKRTKEAFRGGFRVIEITRNTEETPDLEFHPHIHALLAVDKTYFQSSKYIHFKEIQMLWKRAMKLKYDPTVFIEKVKEDPNSPEEMRLGKAVAEVAKYTLKSNDMTKGDTSSNLLAVYCLAEALAGRRLQTYSGVFEEERIKLGLDDVTDGDLVHTTEQEADAPSTGIKIFALWRWKDACYEVRVLQVH